ncbi:MAG: phage portal protein, partial [Alphaproteobacteria bacterium]
VPGEATFSNYREARFHLWEDTILPLLDMVLDHLNLWLTPKFGKNLRLSYDPDSIPALALRREATWAKVNNADFLTLNEKRHALGYAPLEGGDSLGSIENA